MKKVLLGILALTMVMCFVACGASGPDLTGKYTCTKIESHGEELDLDGEYIELSSGGKGTMLSGIIVNITWKVSGETITIDALGEYTGTIKDGVIVLDMGGTSFTFEK